MAGVGKSMLGLKPRAVRAGIGVDLPLRFVEEAPSIHSAIRFEDDPAQAWLMAERRRLRAGSSPSGSSPSGSSPARSSQDARRRRDLESAVEACLAGITLGRHWSGSRADHHRIWDGEVDTALIAGGFARRKSAEIRFEPWRPTDVDIDALVVAHGGSERAAAVLDAAADRGRFQIGVGLFRAALAMLPLGLLDEASVVWGEGRNRPARIVVRDAVFAAEDLTLEDMLRILQEVPGALGEEAVGERRETMVFVVCTGFVDRRADGCYTRLEAVDFGSAAGLERAAGIADGHHSDLIERGQRAMSGRVEAALPRGRKPGR